ncbi:unnamed protein product [Polarella glacialis]|uniref:Poly [ADP-ribose] polymerase n=1 Tax=Polarella glacialis TaxID=89957 RepID=A0A813GJP3_POLGL|nr:unnamed protein product [Polarella glacialis]
MALPADKVPPYWSTTSGCSIVPDPGRLAEFQDLVTKTWRVKYTRDRKDVDESGKVPTGARILNVLRVENHALYHKYRQHVTTVQERRTHGCPRFDVCTKGSIGNVQEDINEMFLFHGTNPEAADAIARTDFKLDRAGSAVGTMFGPGIYLAEKASKSDEYAKEGGGIFIGQCALLICRAVGGLVYTDTEKGDHSMKVKSGNHDSVCGDRLAAVGTFREFVFFDEAAAYCEFIVIYTRLYDGVSTAVPGAAMPAAAIASATAPSSGRVIHDGAMFRLEFDVGGKGVSWESVAASDFRMTRTYFKLSGEQWAGPYHSDLHPGDCGNKGMGDRDINNAFSQGGFIKVSGGGQSCIVRFPGGQKLPAIELPAIEHSGTKF